jgi:hypothetical protein
LKAYFDHKEIALTPAKGNSGEFVFLKDVLLAAERHFAKEKRALVQAIKVIQGNSNYQFSQDFLNSINHNHTVFSNGKQVKDAWDQMQPILEFVLDPK